MQRVLAMGITLLMMSVFIQGSKMSNITWNAVQYQVIELALSKKLKVIL